MLRHRCGALAMYYRYEEMSVDVIWGNNRIAVNMHIFVCHCASDTFWRHYQHNCKLQHLHM